MPRWLAPLLRRIRTLAAQGRVRLTHKALHELALLELALDERDACDVLRALRVKDFGERLVSERTREWLYVFRPCVSGRVLYVKVIMREDCVVVSLHEQVDDENEDE